MSDEIRNYNFDLDDQNLNDNFKIALLLNDLTSSKMKLVNNLTSNFEQFQFLISATGEKKRHFNKASNYQFIKSLEGIKRANAAIVCSEQDSIRSAHLNCPHLILQESKGFWQKNQLESPLINDIVDTSLVKKIPTVNYDDIVNELNKILNNHQYCASHMHVYQSFKEIIGTEFVARKACKWILEWLENLND